MKHHLTLSDKIIQHLIIQECRLLKRNESPEILQKLIDDEFLEIGSGTNCYKKADVIQWLFMQDKSICYGTNFSAKLLVNHLVLLTYTSHIQKNTGEPIKKASRSSIWRKQDDIWQMVFHQCTPITDQSS